MQPYSQPAHREAMNLFRRGTLSFAGLALLPLVLSACAIGNKYDYSDARGALAYGGSGKVHAAVHDQRPNVIEDPDEAAQVGKQRTRYGIPFSVRTASGRPLAEDMGESLQRTLNAAGFDAERVLVLPNESAAVAKARLLSGTPKRAVLLRIDAWSSDTLNNPTVRYDLTMTVYDPRGAVLGTKQVQGEDDLQGSFFGAIREAKKNVPLFFEKKLEGMMNSAEIRKALAG
ncbi:MAG: hypothetical protein NVS9B10_21270 [Nevskia sp.]